MRIIINKLAQSYLDELEDVDWNAGHGEQGAIDESNYEDFLADEREKEEASQYDPDVGLRPDYQPEHDVPNIKIVPYRMSEGKTTTDLIHDGIDNLEVIEFGYTTRHGENVGFRRVEPHYTFVASTTGNEVLVTFDRTPGIDETKGRIRAFITGNIHQDGVRYKGENFNPRPEIMRGVY